MRAAARGNGKRSSARRTCPPESPSCRRLARTRSSAVPETTPSCPRDETARAIVQPETPTPSPPWMIFGCSIALLSAPTWHGITPRAARAARGVIPCHVGAERSAMEHPKIIQGGLGVGVSGWTIARAVSSLGQLGVVSGTALDLVLARRLQDGDSGGHVRRALERFPFPRAAARILSRYFLEGGKGADKPYRPMPMHSKDSPKELLELCVAGNFVEVFLAREGHGGPVGINFLEKIQFPVLPSCLLYTSP